MRTGSTLHIRVGEGFGANNGLNQGFSDPISFSLNGSNAAISEAIECAIEPPRPSVGAGLGGAIEDEIEASLASLAARECDFGRGIWRSGSLNDSRVFYLDDNGETSRRNVYFERWTDNKIVARMYGDLILGASAAGVSILNEYHPYDAEAEPIETDDRVAFAAVEFVYESDRDTPDKFVFAGLNQMLSDKGSDHVDFYGDVEDPDHVFAGPNDFSFFSCRTEPVKLEPAPLSRP
jgi:hypothetical protein